MTKRTDDLNAFMERWRRVQYKLRRCALGQSDADVDQIADELYEEPEEDTDNE